MPVVESDSSDDAPRMPYPDGQHQATNVIVIEPEDLGLDHEVDVIIISDDDAKENVTESLLEPQSFIAQENRTQEEHVSKPTFDNVNQLRAGIKRLLDYVKESHSDLDRSFTILNDISRASENRYLDSESTKTGNVICEDEIDTSSPQTPAKDPDSGTLLLTAEVKDEYSMNSDHDCRTFRIVAAIKEEVPKIAIESEKASEVVDAASQTPVTTAPEFFDKATQTKIHMAPNFPKEGDSPHVKCHMALKTPDFNLNDPLSRRPLPQNWSTAAWQREHLIPK